MSGDSVQEDKVQTLSASRLFELAVRLGLIFLLIFWCGLILSPFFMLVLWGGIIAIAVFPAYRQLCGLLGGRQKLAAIVYALLTLALLLGPTVMISESLFHTSRNLAQGFQDGSLVIPPPDERVRSWPLIGEEVHRVWTQASGNLYDTLDQYRDEIKKLMQGVIAMAGSAGSGIMQFVFSIIISAIFLLGATAVQDVSLKIFDRIAGDKSGHEYVCLIKLTIRSVAQGVLGIALIQAVLAGLGMYVMEVPGWGLWTVVVLVLAVAQLPPLVILGPVIAYVYSVADTTPATVFAIWSVLVGMIDSFLKPFLLGRGVKTPMLVILLGAIGGMLTSGIIGLFVGAVVLAIGYELFMAWLNEEQSRTEAG